MTLARTDSADSGATGLAVLIDSELNSLVETYRDRHPASLYGAVSHAIASGGKRLRPRLLCLVGRALGAPIEHLIPAAAAIEVFHNFTLVHDDIMDNAPTRRGRPTVHEKWDGPTAILAGDLLLGVAYDLVSRSRPEVLPVLMRIFGSMVVKLCEGQALDMEFEQRTDVSLAEYLEMIDGKTGALLDCCFRMAGVIADSEEPTIERLGSAGRAIGRAFQIQDDLLDLVSEDPKWGKQQGGDMIEGKKAYLLLAALESEDPSVRTWFQPVAESGLDPARVAEALELLSGSGVLAAARSEVTSYSSQALEALDILPDSDYSSELRQFVVQLRDRAF